MKKLLLTLPLAMCLFSFSTKPKRVIFFGDSITEAGLRPGGYIVKIQEILVKNGKANDFELLGSGIGGNKIYDLFLRLDKDVLEKKPDVVVIFVGVNDVWHKRLYGTGTDSWKFVQFYEALIQKLKSQNIQVMLATPACIGEKTDCTNEMDGDLNFYAQMIRELSNKHLCPIADFRKIFMEHNLVNNPENLPQGILTSDGVHLNDVGNELVAKTFLEMI